MQSYEISHSQDQWAGQQGKEYKMSAGVGGMSTAWVHFNWEWLRSENYSKGPNTASWADLFL